MRVIISAFLLILAITAKAEIASIDDFSAWLSNYYEKPSPSAVGPSFKKADELGVFKDAQKVGPPTFGFIAGVVQSEPTVARKLIAELSSINEQSYGLVLIGIWYANLPNEESRNIVSQELNKHPALKAEYPFLNNRPASLLSLSPKQGAWVLDAMWGYFFATGQDEPVINIISVLPWIDESKKSEIIAMGKPGMYLLATSGSAKWSLTSNSRQHKRVLEICETQIQKQPDIVSKQLKEIVAKAKQ